MPSTIVPTLQTLIDTPLLRFARCWRITRTDAVIELWTDHLAQITVGTEVFEPADFSASASEMVSGFDDNNIELRGAFNNTKITKADAKARVYDDARIEILTVDHRYPYAGFIRKDLFLVDTVRYSDDVFLCDVLSLPGVLLRKTGRLLNRDCDASAFDDRCSLVAATYEEAGTISAVTDRRAFDATVTVGGGLPVMANARYDHGTIEWLTGNNAGFVSDVKTSLFSTPTTSLTLQIRTPNTVQIGDTFNILPGCNKTLDDCEGTAGAGARTWPTNKVNFRGFPDMPGTGSLIRTP